jgi:hypothetical protein
LTTPRFSGRELSTAITILSARYRPLGLLLPRSGLERSDFVPWPIATEIHVAWHVRDQDKSGLVVLNVSFVARDRTLVLSVHRLCAPTKAQ